MSKKSFLTILFIISNVICLTWLTFLNKPYFYYIYKNKILFPSIFISLIIVVINFSIMLNKQNKGEKLDAEIFQLRFILSISTIAIIQNSLFFINKLDVTLPVKEEYKIKGKSFKYNALGIDFKGKYHLLSLPRNKKFNNLYEKAKNGNVIILTYKNGLLGLPIIQNMILSN